MARRPRKRGKRRRKGTYSTSKRKLANKRIDTLFEARALEITRKELAKSYVWYNGTSRHAQANFNFDTHGPFARIPDSSCLALSGGSLEYFRLTDFGEKLSNDLINTVGDDLDENYIMCRGIQCTYDLRYSGSVPCQVKIFIVEVPGALQLVTGGTSVPHINMCPGGTMNVLFKYRDQKLRDSVHYKFRVVAKKTVWLRPAKQYTNRLISSNSGSNQGYNFVQATTASAPTHTTVQKIVSINKYFKNGGKRFQVNDGEVRSINKEYYVCILSDMPIAYVLVTQTPFRLGGIQDKLRISMQPAPT